MNTESPTTSCDQASSVVASLPAADPLIRAELQSLSQLPAPAIHKTLVAWRVGEDESRRGIATELLARMGRESVGILLAETNAPDKSVSYRLMLLEALSCLGQPLTFSQWSVLTAMERFGAQVRSKILEVLTRMGYACDPGGGREIDEQHTAAAYHNLMLDRASGKLFWQPVKRPLPSLGWRGMLRLMKCLGGYVSGQSSHEILSMQLRVSPQSVASCLGFLAELGLVRLQERGAAATSVLVDFVHQYRRSARKALPLLATAMRQSWVWSAVQRRLSAGAVEEEELIELLDKASGAGTESRSQLLFVAEMLGGVGLVRRDPGSAMYSLADGG